MARQEAGRARPKNKKPAGKGGNGRALKSSDNEKVEAIAGQTVGKADTEAFLIWETKVRRQQKVYDKAKELADAEKSSLGGIYASAKEAGIPASRLSALKKRIKEEKRDPADLIAEAKEIAWQETAGKTMGKLRQLGMYFVQEPTDEAYELMGYEAGKVGGSVDNAPGNPGDSKHTNFMNGYKRGQKELMSKDPLFKSGDEEQAAT